jgi:hypothetical protein
LVVTAAQWVIILTTTALWWRFFFVDFNQSQRHGENIYSAMAPWWK